MYTLLIGSILATTVFCMVSPRKPDEMTPISVNITRVNEYKWNCVGCGIDFTVVGSEEWAGHLITERLRELGYPNAILRWYY